MQIVVCPLSAVDGAIASHGARHLISLLSEPARFPAPAGIDAGRHLKLHVNDIVMASDGMVAPAPGHARELIGFAQAWDRAAPLVIHCFAGISRSTAAALIVMSAMGRGGDELEIALAMRAAAPEAAPNRLLVAHGDRALGRGGRLIAAVEAMGPANFAAEGRVFSLAPPLAARTP